jgi:hypothetical protein
MGKPHYRCRDCLGETLLCGSCIVEGHVMNPFHRMEVCVFLHNLSLNLW